MSRPRSPFQLLASATTPPPRGERLDETTSVKDRSPSAAERSSGRLLVRMELEGFMSTRRAQNQPQIIRNAYQLQIPSDSARGFGGAGQVADPPVIGVDHGEVTNGTRFARTHNRPPPALRDQPLELLAQVFQTLRSPFSVEGDGHDPMLQTVRARALRRTIEIHDAPCSLPTQSCQYIH